MAVFECKDNIFVLESANTHYVVGIDKDGVNRHIYWGPKCSVDDYFTETWGDENSNHTTLDSYKQELSVFGGTMYRDCTVKAEFSDGCREIEPVFKNGEVSGNSLRLVFSDRSYPLEIILNYSVSDNDDIITKYITVKNLGDSDIVFERLFSAEFSLPTGKPYTFLNTNGAWAGEDIRSETVLDGGELVFESRRGISGHNTSPYFIAHRNADEEHGRVYFGALAYSGNFKVCASYDLFGITRVVMGMNDFDFAYRLCPGESFDTPAVYSGCCDGLGEMSRQMNRFALENVLPKNFADKPLPVLYNSWEATEFNVSVKNQTELASLAAKIGVELFVMDDGWFGKRNNDRAGLGDWYENTDKFPNGLDELIDKVNALGMDFGLWVEPEMVNADSELFRAHPDWAYHYERRTPHELRHQIVLNLTRDDVKQYIKTSLDTLLTKHNIKYIKWDMNRPFSETGAQNLKEPKMLWYKHTEAVYEIVDFLKEKHPDTMIESCASGGGRTDYGALSHFDQTWPSDNTDAVDRMTIQREFSLLRPTKAMRAWVTDIGWITKPATLDFRFNIAMQGSLGLGGDLTKYTAEELEICRKNIEKYKEIRTLVQFGDMYRIADPNDGEVLINQFVSRDKSESVVFIAAEGTRYFKKRFPMVLRGLDPQSRYYLKIGSAEYVKSGAYFMNSGIDIEVRGAYYNRTVTVKKV